LEPAIPEAEAAKIVQLIDEVQQEDVIICESVQRGLESGFYNKVGRQGLSKGQKASFRPLSIQGRVSKCFEMFERIE
jgi:hypothetical protein